MRIFPNISCWSLRRRLVSIIILSSTICLFISLSILIGSSIASRYKDSLRELSGLADILAENGQAALAFSDHAEARRLLESMQGHHEISSAWLVNSQGIVLASWSRQGTAGEVPADYRVQIRQLNSDFWSRRANLYRPVSKGQEQIGHVILSADFTEQWSSLLAVLKKGLVGAALALMLILPFAWYFATAISYPIKKLSRIFRDVASARQTDILDRELQELEKEKVRPDELRNLVQSFIIMHEAVNQKIQQINELNASLEQKIKERTAALVASEQETRTLIENTPDTIARYNRECRRTYVNSAFGALAVGGVAALLGKKPSEIPGGVNSVIYETKINEVFVTGNNVQFELKWNDKNGKEICSHICLTAEYDTSGQIASVLGVGRDISELNEYRAELQRKEQAKSRFLSAAGHDLRQPLAAANLFVGALKFTAPTPKQDKIIQSLDQAMLTFNGLLDSLLNISKLDSGVIKPEYTLIDVATLFNWLELNFAPLATEKKVGFKLHFPTKESLVVQSDIGLVKSVLSNLVGNAIKYTIKGSILVSARRRGNGVLFQVWDTGIGIKVEHMERIFDEFYQIDNPQRDRAGGLGLGLAIVERAITLLGSRITFRTQIGQGSVFEFRLPLYIPTEVAKQQIVTESLHGDMVHLSFVQGKRFVVVEDDIMVAQALTIFLDGLGVEVECFHSADDALNHVDIGNADCYIADYMLGGTFNGIQFLNLLHQRLGRPINAVLTTGDTSADFIRDSADFGWPVLHKPVKMEKLITTLRTQEGRHEG